MRSSGPSTTNKDLELANLAVREKGEAIAAARTDYLPKLLGNDTYFHFNANLGIVNTVQTGRLGILPVATHTVAVTAVNQNSNLASITLAQPITKLIAVNAAVKLAKADEQIAQAQLAQGTRELLSGVAQAFYGLNAAQRIETALRLQVGYAEQFSRVNPSPDVRVAVIEARQALNQVHGQAVDIAEQLNNLIGFPAGTILVLEEPMPPPPPVHSADEAASLALACNPQDPGGDGHIPQGGCRAPGRPVRVPAGHQHLRLLLQPDRRADHPAQRRRLRHHGLLHLRRLGQAAARHTSAGDPDHPGPSEHPGDHRQGRPRGAPGLRRLSSRPTRP